MINASCQSFVAQYYLICNYLTILMSPAFNAVEVVRKHRLHSLIQEGKQ